MTLARTRFALFLAAGAALLLGSACGSAEASSNLPVYVGYADSGSPDPAAADSHQAAKNNFPSPWEGSKGVNFVGTKLKNGYDSGAVRIDNPGDKDVTIDSLGVKIGDSQFQLVKSATRVPAHGSLILTQTAAVKETPLTSNFDGSEANGDSCTANSNLVPAISIKAGSSSKTINDPQKVLNSGGVDPGSCPGKVNESHQWVQAGAFTPGETDNESSVWADLGLAGATAGLVALLAALPALLGALLLLLIGWLLAKTVARLVVALIDRLGLGAAAERLGLLAFVRRDGRHHHTLAARIFGMVVFWFIFLIFLEAAADALHLTALKTLLTGMALFLPNLAVALIIVVIGALLADMAKGFHRLAKPAVLVFTAFIALEQLGIGQSLLDVLFAAFVLSAASAIGIAFGLGGQGVAGEIVRRIRPTPQ